MSNKYYIINYDYGCGPIQELITAKNFEDAENEAYLGWKEGVESNSDWGVEEATRESIEELGLDPTDYGFEPVDYGSLG